MAVDDGTRTCPNGHLMVGANLMVRQGRARCRTCHRDRERERKGDAYRAMQASRPPRPCQSCGVLIDQTGHARRYCSDPCRWRHKNRLRRELPPGATPFTKEDVFQRDAWVCQLCQTPIDRSLPWPDPGSPSTDHVVPVSKGGLHVLSNVAAAHLGCNLEKAARTLSRDNVPTTPDAPTED